MLATTARPWHTLCPPAAPSPLSPISANACRIAPSPLALGASAMSWDTQNSTKPSGAAAARRPAKRIPVLQSREATQQRRRDVFLRQVQQRRDDRRWTTRSDEIQRREYADSRRQWEQGSASEAAPAAEDADDHDAEEERDAPGSSPPSSYGTAWAQFSSQAFAAWSSQHDWYSVEDEADALLKREAHDLEALVAAMEQPASNARPPPAAFEHFGSDIFDYDQVFEEMLAHQAAEVPDDADAMDTSEG